eukprot:GILJ01022604.1.p1 GENE.GILJ01022604.1~~GILJ01022604.1.p1  ORF type:complete len:108 (+),score=10.68 GILJ01022604.1:604-927(+)
MQTILAVERLKNAIKNLLITGQLKRIREERDAYRKLALKCLLRARLEKEVQTCPGKTTVITKAFISQHWPKLWTFLRNVVMSAERRVKKRLEELFGRLLIGFMTLLV